MLKNMRYFVSVVETGSFTKAARACGVGQPAVSKGVRTLENEMKAVLLKYEGGRCVPTEAGRVCYAQAKDILTRYDNMKKLVRREETQFAGVISLVYLTFGYLSAFTPIYQAFQREHSQAQLMMRYDTYGQAKAMLAQGKIDGYLVSSVETGDNVNSDSVVIHRSRMIALIPKRNSLAAREKLWLRDLCNERLVLYDPTVIPLLHGAYVEACKGAGFTPNVVDTGRKVAELAAKAVLNEGVALVDDTASYVASENMAVVPIEGYFPQIDICLVWNRRHMSQGMQLLSDYCRGNLG